MPENNEDKRKESFRRVATRRTNKILEQIRILGNCSNKSSYMYTHEEVQKIFSAIESEIRLVKTRFNDNRKRKKFNL